MDRATDRTIAWERGKMKLTPYVLVLPGKLTGLLSVAPIVENIEEGLCLGIVSKTEVLEMVPLSPSLPPSLSFTHTLTTTQVFYTVTECRMWQRALMLLTTKSHSTKTLKAPKGSLVHQC